MNFTLRTLATVEGCYPEKFGVPRQSGLVPSARGRLVFEPDVPEAAYGELSQFSHLWVNFIFHDVREGETRWTVRPPRLGGNEKIGVLATRSPFRPNRLGLSLVRLEGVGRGYLEVSGLDLVDGTPVVDVRPYLPYAEALPEACGGFAGEAPGKVEVRFPEKTDLCEEEMGLIRETLALDPRPAFHKDPTRVYFLRVRGLEVHWRSNEERVEILKWVRG